MATVTRRTFPRGGLLDARPRYHLRYLREDATNPDVTTLERLALVRDCVRWAGEIRETSDSCE